MGLFTKSSSLKFKKIPSAPEQKRARSYLVDLMGTDLSFPEQQIAELTPSEQAAQKQVASYLESLPEDYASATGYYKDVLEGGYNPSTSMYYQGYRDELARLKDEAQAGVRRTAQKAGVARSTSALNIEQRTGQEYDTRTMQLLGQLLENERTRKGEAAQGISSLRGSQISQIGAAEQVAAQEREVQQAKLNAAFQKVLQDLLAPYQYNAQIASALLGEQRYAGYTAGGGLTDLGFMASMASGVLSSYLGAGGGGGGEVADRALVRREQVDIISIECNGEIDYAAPCRNC